MSFPDLNRLRVLFDRLIELPTEQRSLFLSSHEGLGDETLAQLRQLLHDDEALAAYTAKRLNVTARPASPRDWIGQRIGSYEVERTIGTGGMGCVLFARRVDGNVRQHVAIKVLHDWRRTAEARARFRLEGQVLALLRHPRIATLFAVDELPDGTPYLVMEYVEGVPLTEFLQRHNPTLRQRLMLFLQICDAVAYAHRNLVVHRDQSLSIRRNEARICGDQGRTHSAGIAIDAAVRANREQA
jgi:eukaryotic-like serine/threonine-protein kinase